MFDSMGNVAEPRYFGPADNNLAPNSSRLSADVRGRMPRRYGIPAC